MYEGLPAVDPVVGVSGVPKLLLPMRLCIGGMAADIACMVLMDCTGGVIDCNGGLMDCSGACCGNRGVDNGRAVFCTW